MNSIDRGSMDLLTRLRNLSDAHIARNLTTLKQHENEVVSDILVNLGEMIRRESYRALGFSSPFSYLRESLGYSEGGAQRRLLAAKVLLQNPELYAKIRSGALSLSAVAEIAKVKEAEVQRSLLVQAEGQSRRKVEELVAAVLPPVALKRERVRVRRVVTGVPAPAPLLEAAELRTNMGHSLPPPAAEVVYSVNLEVDAETMALLTEAKAIAGGKNVDVIRKALTEFVEKHSPVKREERREKRKTSKARVKVEPKAKSLTVTRHVPSAMRDRIFVRDERRCTFVGADGRRCSERRHLEVDHVRPFSLGGGHEEGNLRVLCRAHNQLMAERVFGKEKILAMRKRV